MRICPVVYPLPTSSSTPISMVRMVIVINNIRHNGYSKGKGKCKVRQMLMLIIGILLGKYKIMLMMGTRAIIIMVMLMLMLITSWTITARRLNTSMWGLLSKSNPFIYVLNHNHNYKHNHNLNLSHLVMPLN